MKQYFYVLFNSTTSVFYQDSQFGVTDDILMAEHYNSYEKAEEELRFHNKDKWIIKKATVSID